MLLPEGRGSSSTIQIDLREPSQMESCIVHTFAHRERFKPQTLTVNNRKNRRVVCVLGQDKRSFRIFDVGARQADEGDDTDTPMDDG